MGCRCIDTESDTYIVHFQEGHAAGDFVRIINKEYDDLNSKKAEFDTTGHQVSFEVPA